jgi:hypothetical protein
LEEIIEEIDDEKQKLGLTDIITPEQVEERYERGSDQDMEEV